MVAGDNATARSRGLALGGVLLAGAVARFWSIASADGLYWPDEVFQSLEPAHRLVFGYGWQAWEFAQGARSWFLPGLIAGVFKVCAAIGVDDSSHYLGVVEVLFAAANLTTAVCVGRLARRLGASGSAALGAVAATALSGVSILISTRATGENLGALPVVAGLGLLVAPTRRAEVLWGAALLVVATFLRLQHGYFCLAAVGMVAVGPRRRDVLPLLGVFAVGALSFGLFDELTWGRWFHSAFTYVSANLMEGKASNYGVAPVWHYLTSLTTAEPLLAPVAVGLAVFGGRAALPISATALGYIALHSLIPHKELRFVWPAVPLLFAAAAVGLSARWPAERTQRRAAWVAIALAVASAMTAPWLTFGRLGIGEPPRATRVFDFAGAEARLLRLAGEREDLCGLWVKTLPPYRIAGYASLHRPVPLYPDVLRTGREGRFNFVIARVGDVAGEEIARDGERALVKVGAVCEPDPEFDWSLE